MVWAKRRDRYTDIVRISARTEPKGIRKRVTIEVGSKPRLARKLVEMPMARIRTPTPTIRAPAWRRTLATTTVRTISAEATSRNTRIQGLAAAGAANPGTASSSAAATIHFSRRCGRS